MNLVTARCPSCNVPINFNPELDKFTCNACGSVIYNDKNEKVIKLEQTFNYNYNITNTQVKRDENKLAKTDFVNKIYEDFKAEYKREMQPSYIIKAFLGWLAFVLVMIGLFYLCKILFY